MFVAVNEVNNTVPNSLKFANVYLHIHKFEGVGSFFKEKVSFSWSFKCPWNDISLSTVKELKEQQMVCRLL